MLFFRGTHIVEKSSKILRSWERGSSVIRYIPTRIIDVMTLACGKSVQQWKPVLCVFTGFLYSFHGCGHFLRFCCGADLSPRMQSGFSSIFRSRRRALRRGQRREFTGRRPDHDHCAMLF
jgi:hypothetical protein